jgi:glycosyltransferase involved in cell wall biosynthesis
MIALFIHDHCFYTANDLQYYSGGGLPFTIWSRYLKYFERVIVIARGKKVIKINRELILSSINNVEFHLFYNVQGGLDYFTNQKTIKNQLLLYTIRADIVIIRLPSTIGLFAADLCCKLNKYYATEVVGCAWDSIWNYGTLLHRIYAPYAYLKMRKIVKNSIGALYVTKKFLQQRYPMTGIQESASNVQIPNILDNVLQKRIKHIYRKKNVYTIGIIGDLSVAYKGYDIALKALKQLKALGIKFQFYLVGGGDLSYIQKLISKNHLQENTTIIGRLQYGEAIFHFLDELDLYIHPSRQEGLPRSVIEAMSRACPVIASNIAGIPELLPQEYMHNPSNYRKLAFLILTVLFDKMQLLAMAKNNFIKSKEYRMDILQERINTFYGTIKSYYEN